MKEFFDKFSKLKGAKFIGVNNYTNKYGEIANINLVANVDIRRAKEKDLETLKKLSGFDLDTIAKDHDLPRDMMETALGEMIESAEKNLSMDMDEHTNQSKAQSDSYLHLTKSVRMHKESLEIFVSGFINSKNILVQGDYPKRNKRVKTLCKDAIEKHCGLKMSRYRQYNIGSMERINITGSTLNML